MKQAAIVPERARRRFRRPGGPGRRECRTAPWRTDTDKTNGPERLFAARAAHAGMGYREPERRLRSGKTAPNRPFPSPDSAFPASLHCSLNAVSSPLMFCTISTPSATTGAALSGLPPARARAANSPVSSFIQCT